MSTVHINVHTCNKSENLMCILAISLGTSFDFAYWLTEHLQKIFVLLPKLLLFFHWKLAFDWMRGQSSGLSTNSLGSVPGISMSDGTCMCVCTGRFSLCNPVSSHCKMIETPCSVPVREIFDKVL